MNDWEIGGTQNAWVCPSDRHLQLRAQLKSGWSVRTATARSPTNAKQITGGGITDAEREQIQAVLARAEAGKQQETQRIARMVDRLEKMRSRATGNGVTQCLLCQTEFGLLASKSYAAMCLDCRKYVCQKNCGVETFDQKRGEMIFLCKICSEYREMWKKSGAWFYREVPQVLKNAESPSTSMGNGTPIGMNGNSSPRQMNYSTWQHHGDTKPMPKPPVVSAQANAMATMSLKDAGSSTGGTPRPSRQLPIPPDQQQRLKTTPRPRITPSWVHEKVQSSMSIGSEDEESSSSAESEYKSGAAGGSSSAIPSSRRHHYNRPRDLSHRHGGSAPGSARTGRRDNASLQRYVLGTRSRITDTEESENDESRRTTPSTSPRHSLATPSSYGGDDVSQNHTSLAAANNEASDAKSIDSGVVQSDDHSVHQRQLRETAQSAPPSSLSSYAVSPVRHTSGAAQPPLFVQVQGGKPTANELARTTPSPVPPPIPPRTGAGSFGSPLQFAEQRRPSTASSSTASSSVPSRNVQMSHESLHSNFKSRPSSTHSSEFLGPHGEAHGSSMNSDSLSRNSTQSTAPVADLVAKEEETIGSPTFMSSPEDETSTLGSVQFNLTYFPEEKQLIIHLIRAKNLKAMDKNGLSDPYVKFHLIPGNTKATKITSKTIEKTLNPEWHEEMIYYGITEEERLRKTLRLTVLDRDRIGSDFLGETRVALEKLPLGVTKKFNLYLEHAMPAPVEKAEEAERGKILLAVCYNIQQGSLFVHIKRCAELMGMDSSGFSDPYCKVSLTPLSSKAHRQKTAIKKRTLNPEFNEASATVAHTLQFIVPFKDLPKKTLEIGVYDHDVGRHDDYIGGILLSTAAKADRGKQWTQCIENPGKTFEYWHRLETE
ncbi:RBF-1 protein [Aphelenchoides avenae]|nr:RBF-1 protein [Aphelenchus avenae]